MAVRIRLQRKGRRNRAFYWVVVADSRAPRDGKFIEKIGYYDPIPDPEIIEIDVDRALHWLNNGAQPTEAARVLLKKAGVFYKKFLTRGISLGKLSEEEAKRKFEEFLKRRQEKILKRIQEKRKQEEIRKQEWLKAEEERARKREERYRGKSASDEGGSSPEPSPDNVSESGQ